MSQKSLETFLTEVKSGRLSTNRHIVFNKVKDLYVADLDMLRQRLRMPHQSLTSALSILNDWGVIWQDDKGYYRVTSAHDVERIAAQRETVRFEKWKKAGEKNGWFARQFQEDLDCQYSSAVGVDETGQTHLL